MELVAYCCNACIACKKSNTRERFENWNFDLKFSAYILLLQRLIKCFVSCCSLYPFFFFSWHVGSPFSGIILYRFRWQYQEDIFEESKLASIFYKGTWDLMGLSCRLLLVMCTDV